MHVALSNTDVCVRSLVMQVDELHDVLHVAGQHQLHAVDRCVSDHKRLGCLAKEQRKPVEAWVNLAISRNQLVLEHFDDVVAVNLD